MKSDNEQVAAVGSEPRDLAVEMLARTEDRYHRLRQIPWWDQERLQGARVMVVGAGALGNEILKNLALLGIGHVLICDMDVVEASNLSRSVLFRAEDTGRPKSQVAAERVMELNPGVRAAWFQGNVVEELGLGVFRRMDVVIGGVDNIQARVAVNDACWMTSTPYVDGGTHFFEGQVRVFAAPEGPCYQCTLTEAQYEHMNERIGCREVPGVDPDFAKQIVPTTPIASSVIAAMEVQEAVSILHGEPPRRGQTLVYDGIAQESYVATFEPKDNDFHVHSDLAPIADVEELPLAVASATAHDLLLYAEKRVGAGARLELGRNFVVSLQCVVCDEVHALNRAANLIEHAQLFCPRCGEEGELEVVHSVSGESPLTDRRLTDLGVPPLDVLMAHAGGRMAYLELAGDAPKAGFWHGEMSEAGGVPARSTAQ